MHIVAVPLFLAGNLGLVVALLRGSVTGGAIGLACMIISMALQGRGHKIEKTPPEPFTGVKNAVARILLEQWITFPRFVLSGGWSRALRTSSDWVAACACKGPQEVSGGAEPKSESVAADGLGSAMTEHSEYRNHRSEADTGRLRWAETMLIRGVG